MPVHRRDFLKASLGVPFLGPSARHAQAATPVSYLQDSPDMLFSYLSAKLTTQAAAWDRKRAQIRTAADVETRNRFVREKFLEMLGGYPERGPLAPIVVRTLQRKGYRIENVMFQSRPDFWVTGNLYIPDGPGPFPAVLSPCGHYPLARMYPDYQCAYLNLVHSGFVVLGFDPIGQGERRQYWDPQTGKDEFNDSVYEHSMPGLPLLLVGENLTQYRVWDGMRGIDYLLTRPEVDPQRIGCAGHSGGATLTLFISALDQRVKCSVLSESGTAHWWPMQVPLWGRVPAPDIEQNLFPSALYGIDRCDLDVAIAPRPLLTMIEEYAPRFNLAADHIRERYRQLGVPERFATERAGDPHAWTVKLRLAASRWLSRWLYQRPGLEREPEFDLEKPEDLYCTPNGSVRYSRRGDTIFSLLLNKQAVLPGPRAAAAESEMLETLRIRKLSGPLDVRQLDTTPRKGYRIEKVQFVSEPGIYIPAWVFVPERRTSRTVTLIVNTEGREADGLEFGPCEKLMRQGRIVIAVDVRGVGDTAPPHPQPTEGPVAFRHLFDVQTGLGYMAWNVDECLFGMRVQDVLRSVDYAFSRPDAAAGNLELIGQGEGALWALYAAALDRRIASVVAERGLLSYRTLLQVDRYLHNAGIFVRGVLKRFDLPHVAAAIAPRPLLLRHPLDAMKHPVAAARAHDVYRVTAEAYRQAGAAESFRIV